VEYVMHLCPAVADSYNWTMKWN